MKRVVRRHIFETNSSSSHALSIKRTEDAKSDKRASFLITDALQKIVWFFCVTAECEDHYEGMISYYCDGKTIEETREELIEIIRGLYDKNKESYDWYFSDIDPDFDEWDADDIIQFFTVVCEDKIDDVFDKLCAFDAAAARKTVLQIRDRLVEIYGDAEHISKEGVLARIDKEYAEYNELVRAIEDPAKHARARWILRRVSMLVESDYEKATDKRAVLEEYKKKFEEQELNHNSDCFSCTRFFSEGSMYECNCGFETYDSLLDNFEGFSDDAGLSKFLSPEIAVVGYEW